MSRSYRKTKIQGNTVAKSEKEDKQKANRKFRRVVKEKVNQLENELPDRREVSNVWNFAKDGKRYISSINVKYMRK
ncbi:hypothetical protein [Wenyingzhuangia aestuarii]|uniref:hypothetical protein n=1 Tax=Wenyingzhuangia aestuarii TaxID=1647582 RepID=UPI00143B7EE7|nr:hypothetical protein [Wenyingzhuangia aestuarii]NJB82812.1 TATA-binding protein-associated factor Taf7 [Wenyingzhuangia aestuarii]